MEMTRAEYDKMHDQIESGEIDYDELPIEVKKAYRAHIMDRKREEAAKDPFYTAMFGDPTDLSNPRIYSQPDVPSYTTHSEPPILYDKTDKKAERIARDIEKKRKPAIKKAAKKVVKRQKKLSKKEKKELEKRKKKLIKKAGKILKKLPPEKQEEFRIYDESHKRIETAQAIIDYDEKRKKKDKQFALEFACFVGGHEYDPSDPKDVEILERELNREASPMERYLERKRNSSEGDVSKIFEGGYIRPRLPVEKDELDWYADSPLIKDYDWEDYVKYIKGKKLKGPEDSIKYRRKFNWKRLMKRLKENKAPKRSYDGRKLSPSERYMYEHLEIRDVLKSHEMLQQAIRSGQAEKNRREEFMEFLKESGSYKGLVAAQAEKNVALVDSMIKHAKVEYEKLCYPERFPDDGPAPEPYDLEIPEVGEDDWKNMLRAFV